MVLNKFYIAFKHFIIIIIFKIIWLNQLKNVKANWVRSASLS